MHIQFRKSRNHPSDWEAFFVGSEEIYSTGETIPEAIGSLMQEHGEHFGVVVEDVTPSDQLVPFPG